MLRKKNCGASLTMPSQMSSLVVKRGLNIIIIMVIFMCYFSGEYIALSIKKKTRKNNNNGVNIE